MEREKGRGSLEWKEVILKKGECPVRKILIPVSENTDVSEEVRILLADNESITGSIVYHVNSSVCKEERTTIEEFFSLEIKRHKDGYTIKPFINEPSKLPSCLLTNERGDIVDEITRESIETLCASFALRGDGKDEEMSLIVQIGIPENK